MGALTVYLQHEFSRLCPSGWTCQREVRLLPQSTEILLGYSPRVDVSLLHVTTGQRLWIEFEVSRADPVANHAKYASAHIFEPRPETDTFISMVSPHVTRGRRNLAANMVVLMRRVGINAFQTVLFPSFSPSDVQALNHLTLSNLLALHPSVEPEIDRAFSVCQPISEVHGRRIHLAGDLLDVVLNLQQWNQEMQDPGKRELWGKRVITYFVYDRHSGRFAPSKYCAFLPISSCSDDGSTRKDHSSKPVMTMTLYADMDGTSGLFDGNVARTHLTRRLGMVALKPADDLSIAEKFTEWLGSWANCVGVHPLGPTFLVAPAWFK